MTPKITACISNFSHVYPSFFTSYLHALLCNTKEIAEINFFTSKNDSKRNIPDRVIVAKNN